ncbi:MAG: methyltransferase domain-containing protein [Candidatus Dormibacteria bacterium]
MEAGEREQRFIFGEAAELYDRARAGYPVALVDDVLSFARIDGDRLRALEVGAGTGKATVAFAARGIEILALEPSPAMAAVAMRNCRGFPRVRIAVSTFEDWPAETGVFGLLFAAQSWHWVDPAVRWVKAAQALQERGVLALMGHRVNWQGEPVRDEMDEIYARVAPDLLAHNPGLPGLRRERDDGVTDEIIRTGDFDDVTERAYQWSARLTAGGFVDLLATQSDHRLLAEAVRAELFDALHALITAHGGEVVVPELTRLRLARRRAA